MDTRTKMTQLPSVELEELRARLEDAEETLRAIREGDVDALCVGEQIYSLEGTEAASNRFRGVVLDQVTDAVIALDNERLIIYLNPAAERLYGVAAAGALGRAVDELVPLAWFDAMTAGPVAATVKTGGEWRHEIAIATPAGHETHVECVVSGLNGLGMEQIGLLIVSRDVTARKLAEQALRDADRRKDEFLAMLGHELRNPLSPILTAVALLERSGSTDQTVTSATRIIGRQAGHLNDLVSDLLDVARITTGKITLRKENCEMGGVIQRAVEQTRALIEAKGHRIDIETPSAPVYVYGDLSRLTQIVSNLVNNAAKYTEAGGGVIGLRVSADGPDIFVTVTDNGMGIVPEVIPHIFDLFTQSRRSLDRAEGGLGIGLTIVRRLVEMHGGQVTARSEGTGKGSVFTVRLPRSISAAAPGVAARRRAADRQTPLTRRILIVDDNLDAANTLAMVLRMDGHEVDSVHDGLQVVAKAREFRPQVILLDLGLPGLSGLEVARQLRASTDLNGVTLIALTGYGQEEDRRLTHATGFDHHMVKPVDLEQINALIR
jgi:PAS domain S-box-containing protein